VEAAAVLAERQKQEAMKHEFVLPNLLMMTPFRAQPALALSVVLICLPTLGQPINVQFVQVAQMCPSQITPNYYRPLKMLSGG
jgi:hypothetical protein